MAKKVKPTLLRALIGDKNANKMGNYQEATGGGTPLPKGEKLKDHPEAKRTMQPRDENGQFTYNSVNFKERKYDYHGKGDTIPPFMKGVNLSYFVRKDSEINYNGMIHLAGIKMSAREIIDQIRTWREQGGFGKLDTEIKGKVGRRSNENKAKMAAGKEGILKDDTLKAPEKTKEQFVSDLKEALKKYNKKKASQNTIKKAPPKQPTQPTQDLNLDLAKNNPQQFVSNHRKEVDEIKRMVPDISDEKVAELIADGYFKNFDDLKDAIKQIIK